MVLQLKVFVSKINLRFSASFSSFDRYKSSTAARARARQTLEDVSHVPWNPWTRFAQTSLRFQKKGPRKRSEPMFHVLRTRRSKGREGTLSLSLREIRRESIQYWSSRWKRAKEGERIRKYFFFPSRGTIYLVVGVVGRGFVNTRVHIYIYIYIGEREVLPVSGSTVKLLLAWTTAYLSSAFLPRSGSEALTDPTSVPEGKFSSSSNP